MKQKCAQIKKTWLSILVFSLFFGTSFLNADVKKLTTAKPGKEDHKVVVYYFHGNARCFSCKKIEAFTAESMETFFKEDLKNKRVEFQVINVDKKENAHFIQDYQLYTKSVIVADIVKEKQIRWKNLAKIWEFLSDKESFAAYIKEEIAAYQKES